MNIRAFIALPLPSAVTTEIRRIQNVLEEHLQTMPESPAGRSPGRPSSRLVRWTRPESVHLTLRFLGDTPATQIPALDQALVHALAGIPAFTLYAGGIGCFPNPRRPKVLWLGVHEFNAESSPESSRLHTLQAKVEQSVRPLGFAPETKPFRPHLTLGRTARQATGEQMRRVGAALASFAGAQTGEPGAGTVHEQARNKIPFPVREVILFQSELPGRGGGHPVYTPLTRIDLTHSELDG